MTITKADVINRGYDAEIVDYAFAKEISKGRNPNGMDIEAIEGQILKFYKKDYTEEKQKLLLSKYSAVNLAAAITPYLSGGVTPSDVPGLLLPSHLSLAVASLVPDYKTDIALITDDQVYSRIAGYIKTRFDSRNWESSYPSKLEAILNKQLMPGIAGEKGFIQVYDEEIIKADYKALEKTPGATDAYFLNIENKIKAIFNEVMAGDIKPSYDKDEVQNVLDTVISNFNEAKNNYLLIKSLKNTDSNEHEKLFNIFKAKMGAEMMYWNSVNFDYFKKGDNSAYKNYSTNPKREIILSDFLNIIINNSNTTTTSGPEEEEEPENIERDAISALLPYSSSTFVIVRADGVGDLYYNSGDDSRLVKTLESMILTYPTSLIPENDYINYPCFYGCNGNKTKNVKAVKIDVNPNAINGLITNVLSSGNFEFFKFISTGVSAHIASQPQLVASNFKLRDDQNSYDQFRNLYEEIYRPLRDYRQSGEMIRIEDITQVVRHLMTPAANARETRKIKEIVLPAERIYHDIDAEKRMLPQLTPIINMRNNGLITQGRFSDIVTTTSLFKSASKLQENLENLDFVTELLEYVYLAEKEMNNRGQTIYYTPLKFK